MWISKLMNLVPRSFINDFNVNVAELNKCITPFRIKVSDSQSRGVIDSTDSTLAPVI